MFQSNAMRAFVVEEPAPEELLANVLKNAGWIMTGGSAQFRHGALAELQSNLHRVHQQVRNERVLQSVNVLDEKATKVSADKDADAVSILALCRVLGEFEQAMKAYLAGLR